MRTCASCQLELPTSLFGRLGLDGWQHYCLECSRSTRIAHYAANRASTRAKNDARDARYRAESEHLVWAYLQTHPCSDCGETDPLVLQFDHVRGDKDRDISAMIGKFPPARVMEEIGKCAVRCARCHRRVTAIRGRHWKAVALGLCP